MPPASRAQGLVTRRPSASQGPLRASAPLRFSLSSVELTLDTPSEVVQSAIRKLAGELLRSLDRRSSKASGAVSLAAPAETAAFQDHLSQSRRSSSALRAPAGDGRTNKARVSRGFIGRTAPTDSLSPYGGDGMSAWPRSSSTRSSCEVRCSQPGGAARQPSQRGPHMGVPGSTGENYTRGALVVLG